MLFAFSSFPFSVLEHLPPQQGLRLRWLIPNDVFSTVLEHLPPQQGLRLITLAFIVLLSFQY